MTEAEKWNESVSHPMQSWEWGEFRKQRQKIDRVNGMLVIWTKIRFTLWSFGYIPMGRNPARQDMDALFKTAKSRKAIGIRMEPHILKGEKISDYKKTKVGRHLFKPKTFIWDLTATPEELLSRMHQKARYNIKIAQKHGVTVSEDNSDEAFESYLSLMFSGTTKRQKIYAHNQTYHRQMWSSLKGSIAHLFTARYNGKIVAVAMVYKFKDSIYYAYGATALEHREIMAPTLLLWQVALWGRNLGMKYFDLWGAEEGKGFSRFKEQFGATLVELTGTYDVIVNPILYFLFRLSEEVRWKMLRLIK